MSRPFLSLIPIPALVLVAGSLAAQPIVKPATRADRRTLEPAAPPSDIIPGITATVTVPATYDPTNCSFKWTATVSNQSDAAHGTTLQAWGYRNNYEIAVGGTTLALAKGETKTTSLTPGPTIPVPTSIRVGLLEGGKRIALSPMVSLPVLPPFNEAVTVLATASGTSWSVALKSNITQGYPTKDLTAQGYSGPSATGPWTAAGGAGFDGCLPAAQQIASPHAKPAEHKFVKVSITRSLTMPGAPGYKSEPVWERVIEETSRVPPMIAPRINPVIAK